MLLLQLQIVSEMPAYMKARPQTPPTPATQPLK